MHKSVIDRLLPVSQHLVVETAGRIHLACGLDVERILSWSLQTTVEPAQVSCTQCLLMRQSR